MRGHLDAGVQTIGSSEMVEAKSRVLARMPVP
jgi:hypothetical protein